MMMMMMMMMVMVTVSSTFLPKPVDTADISSARYPVAGSVTLCLPQDCSVDTSRNIAVGTGGGGWWAGAPTVCRGALYWWSSHFCIQFSTFYPCPCTAAV